MWLFVPDIYWANLFILILQMIGWLSNSDLTKGVDVCSFGLKK